MAPENLADAMVADSRDGENRDPNTAFAVPFVLDCSLTSETWGLAGAAVSLDLAGLAPVDRSATGWGIAELVGHLVAADDAVGGVW